MEKDCPVHGRFEDVMAIDPAFFAHLESCSRAATSARINDEKLHNHGSSTISTAAARCSRSISPTAAT